MNEIESFLTAKTYAVADEPARTQKYGYNDFTLLASGRRETFQEKRKVPEKTKVPGLNYIHHTNESAYLF